MIKGVARYWLVPIKAYTLRIIEFDDGVVRVNFTDHGSSRATYYPECKRWCASDNEKEPREETILKVPCHTNGSNKYINSDMSAATAITDLPGYIQQYCAHHLMTTSLPQWRDNPDA